MGNLAQIVNPVLPGSLGGSANASGPSAIGSIIGSLVGLLFIFAFVGAFLYMLLGGFDWITAGGDKTKLQGARDKITNALIGLIVVAASWAVMVLVGNFVGIDFPDLKIPTIGG